MDLTAWLWGWMEFDYYSPSFLMLTADQFVGRDDGLLEQQKQNIYKDLYGENNDCFCNLWKCSDLNKNRLTLL